MVGGARDGGRPGARLRDAVHRRPAGRGLRPDGACADAGAPRLLGLAPVVVAVPCDRRDVLVRGAGADGSARDPGALRRDDRRPAAARPARPLSRRRARGARNPRVRRHAVAAEGRAADLARVRPRSSSCCSSATDDPDYAVARVFDSPDQQLTWTGFADVRDGDVRGVAHARREHLGLLPVHADAPGHAYRPGGIGVSAAASSRRSSGATRPRPRERRTRSSRSPISSRATPCSSS